MNVLITVPLAIVLNVLCFWVSTREEVVEKRGRIYEAITSFAIAGILLFMILFYKNQNAVFVLKRGMVLAVLTTAAYTDFKAMKIPNKLVLLGLLYRAVLLPVEFIMQTQYLKSVLLSEIIAAGALLVICLLCRLVMHGSLGYGDMKLMVVMGLLLGLDGIIGAMLNSLLITFIVAVYLMISKKKTKKDVIPFAPFLAIGTCISIILTGM
ncbi:MAG: prepilin peptidase [Lachnospiraceae bacterium]|nr:prepilin peptidase [Lachnospiraceae bacterium]